MKGNRLDDKTDLRMIAKKLEGYTGSDIREVCREAVVRIAHEESKKLEEESTKAKGGVDPASFSQRLRPVTMEDFEIAMKKLSASVAGRGRELERVREWNTQFGRTSPSKTSPIVNVLVNKLPKIKT